MLAGRVNGIAALLLMWLSLAAVAPARSSPPLKTGVWTRATTLATFRGHWLNEANYRRWRASDDADDLLARFPRSSATALASVGLHVGIDVFLKARARPGRPVPIPDKPVEVRFHLGRTRDVTGREFYQPTFVLRLTKLPATPPAPATPTHPPPPLTPPGP